MAAGRESPWNSLEATKLAVGMLTPISLALVGYFVQQQLASQSAILGERVKVYDTISIDLNRIYCFVEDVGTWKDETPEKVIGYKRKLDQTILSQPALWSSDTLKAYREFRDASFEPYQGVAKNAKIRTTDDQKAAVAGWKVEWREELTEERDPEYPQKYDKLNSQFSRDLQQIK